MREKIVTIIFIGSLIGILLAVGSEMVNIVSEFAMNLSKTWSMSGIAFIIVAMIIVSHYLVKFGKRIIDKIVESFL